MAPRIEEPRTRQGRSTKSTEQFKFWTLEIFLRSIFNQHIINAWRSFSPNYNLKYQLIADAIKAVTYLSNITDTK